MPLTTVRASWRVDLLLLGFSWILIVPEVRAAVVEGMTVTFTWAPASGPVAGYSVWVLRDGAASSTPEATVSGSSVTISGAFDETISLEVAAFDEAGNSSARSLSSEFVMFSQSPSPPPVHIAVEGGDFALSEALASASASGEQVSLQMQGTAQKQLLDVAPEDPNDQPDPFGFDQLVVGAKGQPAIVRLVDSLELEGGSLFDPSRVPPITLFGLGNGSPCARDGGPGLRIMPGSKLILGGLDVYAFDGQECVHLNGLFPGGGGDPNVIAYDRGEIQLHGDLEEDGVLDPDDNCAIVANPDQCDTNGDGYGNRCDADVYGESLTDRTGNGLVDGLDLFRFYLPMLGRAEYDPDFDFDCDGVIGDVDFQLIARALMTHPGPSGLVCVEDASCQSD